MVKSDSQRKVLKSLFGNGELIDLVGMASPRLCREGMSQMSMAEALIPFERKRLLYIGNGAGVL